MEAESSFTITCSECGETAAAISFEPHAKIGASMVQRRFLGETFTRVLGQQSATRELFSEIRRIAEKDLKSLRAMDPDFFGFICWHCGAAYCKHCWRNVHPIFDDELFFDEARGTCPRGHEQMLQD